ncbi:Histidine kinase [Rhodovastum atsumiense]|uniref:histidine kinase n=1 Tax=Rhodovastum atsumiense TaxID=504468 RepID=A0A5M6IYH0_9PROT|nr:ATP-binding protein [Rhodovastum atsumiense]KAA5613394.1 response regulator [Rhodovastum atsumiense]CAH2603092.1 Histidine kinase [Rhodovastum atsumiense]
MPGRRRRLTALMAALRRHCPPPAWLLLAGLALALVWGAAALHLRQSRAELVAAQREELATLARILEHQVRSDIENIDRTILLLRSLLESQGEGFDLAGWAQTASFRNELIVQVGLIGPDGMLRATNVGRFGGRMDLSDREHFRVHLGTERDELFISKPVFGRATGRWTLQFTRRFSAPGGGFGGVIVVSVDVEALSRFYEAVGTADGSSIVLFGFDGITRATGPHLASRIGQPVQHPEIVARTQAEDAGTIEGMIRGEASLLAFRRIADRPLGVTVRRAEAKVLQDFRERQGLVLGGAGGVSLLILAILMVSHGLQRRQREAMRMLDAMLVTTSQGMQITGADGRVLVTNRRTAELLGLPAELAGTDTDWAELREWLVARGDVDLDPESPPTSMADAMTGQERAEEYARPDGSVLKVRTVLLPEGGIVRIFTDVTSRHRAVVALEAARDAAEAGLRARASFLATMSHEIRTPINGVIGLAELLQGTMLDAQQLLWVDRLQASADHLLRLVDDILDFSRLDAGQMPFECIPFRPDAVAEGTFRMLEARAAEKGLGWTLELPPAPPPAVLGDPGRLRQVLLNLLGNAIKFTASGGVTLGLAPAVVADGQAELTFTVRDSGIGIAPEALPLLFQEFSQVDGSISRRFGGSGLGLVICARLLERMGGDIVVDSRPGEGSCFRVRLRLPLAPDARASEAAGAVVASPLPPRLAGLRILLAEDDQTNQLVTTAMLDRLGHRVEVAADGHAVVEAMHRGGFDLVLMDMMMPGLDGLGATRAIRAMPGVAAGLPIIALTANALPGDQQHCRDVGMDDFLAKPVRLAALQAMLARHAPRLSAGLTDGVPADPAPSKGTAPAGEAAGFDPRPVREMIAELGKETYAMIRDQFLAEMEARLTKMTELLDRGEREALLREAHSLKSAAAAFGLVALSRMAGETERGATDDAPEVTAARIARLRSLAAACPLAGLSGATP